MYRKHLLQRLVSIPLTLTAMKVEALSKMFEENTTSPKMPILFVGHGNPINAIQENEFTLGFKQAIQNIEKPTAILCISAHWETQGTFVTAMKTPKTIHDFGGFPQALFNVQYPAPGSPELARQTQKLITKTNVSLDESWGLDHGTWSVIKHMYPKADIPLIQLSLDYTKSPQYHFELAQELQALRNKGVLIIGSGNIIHNLRMVAWDKINEPEYGYDWAHEANAKIKDLIVTKQFEKLQQYSSLGTAVQYAIPTPEHYLPLLYVLALKGKNEDVRFFNDKIVAGSLGMTSISII